MFDHTAELTVDIVIYGRETRCDLYTTSAVAECSIIAVKY